MKSIKIVHTKNPAIIKYVFDDFITQQNFEFKQIDQAQDAPLVQELFRLPFIKTIYISRDFIAIEHNSQITWEDVEQDVLEQIISFLDNGGHVLKEVNQPKRVPITVYAESTPNPNVMKFIASKVLVSQPYEFKNIGETVSGIAQALFGFPFVKELFLDENYISITKIPEVSWEEMVLEVREFIAEYLALGKEVIKEGDNTVLPVEYTVEASKEELSETAQKIIDLLDEYVKPAVQADGGNIIFSSFEPENKKVNVIMKGACNGCPSSTKTLKNGIETLLRNMLSDPEITVESVS